jgi:hypothetical protein
MAYARVKFLNSAPGKVIMYIGAEFTYDDGSKSYDPYYLPTQGLKKVDIAHGEAGYCFGTDNKCAKKIWVALTWTGGSGAKESSPAPSDKCYDTLTVELSPTLLYDAAANEQGFQFIMEDIETGQRKHFKIERPNKLKEVIALTEKNEGVAETLMN